MSIISQQTMLPSSCRREQAVRITPSSGLGPDEIARLIEEAARNEQADKVMKDLIIARTRLEGLIDSTRRTFSEFGAMLSEDDQMQARQAISRAELAYRTDELAKLAAAFQELEAFGQKLTATMFASTAGMK